VVSIERAASIRPYRPRSAPQKNPDQRERQRDDPRYTHIRVPWSIGEKNISKNADLRRVYTATLKKASVTLDFNAAPYNLRRQWYL
jgi:hypothetical protein